MQDGQRNRRVKFLAIQVSLYWPLFWALRFPKKNNILIVKTLLMMCMLADFMKKKGSSALMPVTLKIKTEAFLYN